MAATPFAASLEQAWADGPTPPLASELVRRHQEQSAAYLGMRAGMQPGERELQARAAVPKGTETIVMTAGKPDPNLLPFDDLKEFAQKAWEASRPAPLEYGASLLLRTEIARYLTESRGREVEPAEIAITNGNSGGLRNVFQSYLNPGDTAIVESPLWTITVDYMKHCGADVVSVGMDREGILIDAVEQEILAAERRGKRVKMIYVQPLFHNPTGCTMTRARAERLLVLAAKAKIIIVSDEPYEPYWYDSKPCFLSALSGGRGVISVHTFSKTLGTGLRLGWIHASLEFIKPVQTILGFQGESSVFLQYAVGELMASGRFDQIVARAKSVYASKYQVFCDALRTFVGRHLAAAPSATGGFFVWLELAALPANEVHLQMLARGLEARLGSNMYGPGHVELDSGGAPRECHIGLSFIGPSEEGLVEAARRIGAACEAVEVSVGGGAEAAGGAQPVSKL